MRILVVDNYDSFVYNLVQYLGQLGATCEVWRNDDVRLAGPDGGYDPASLAGVVAEFDGVLLSPGPGTPDRAGATIPLIGVCGRAGVPVLGVCLGHQAIGEAFGATVDRAAELMHGKTSRVTHDDSGVLAGIPSPFTATRYHSLTVLPETIPEDLVPTAWTGSGLVMAMRHREMPVHGVQFHPESVMSDGGHRMLANWLGMCGEQPEEALVAGLEQELDRARGAALA
ncbi:MULTISPECIES: aminodeoxychorismate/anthranilate synthase component II [unclassified Dietzia]|uniref:aminodeoxychorismate/anthranilate synthase component II n=1 Tax=unclassified Dietzia TaxID=2617939 RepID=UPI000D21A9B8|nr:MULTISPECIES: aminodeoxychorismate/anthranilate synthase component II [unclassified Dietzia]AVZ38135.1 aminodeoxychorismate/anthranilate synthase component II [Dietzia sp. JS16-p6b]QGW23101.1 para-aminobenzoate synthase component II [Dietzia sp. DQ12-45-1b]